MSQEILVVCFFLCLAFFIYTIERGANKIREYKRTGVFDPITNQDAITANLALIGMILIFVWMVT